MMNDCNNYFEQLHSIDTSEYSNSDELSWATAIKLMRTNYPDSVIEVIRFKNEQGIPLPYLKTEIGYFVEVNVIVNGVSHSSLIPVADKNGKDILKPTATNINYSTQKATVQAIAMHGLGIDLFNESNKITEKPKKTINSNKPKLVKNYGGNTFVNQEKKNSNFIVKQVGAERFFQEESTEEITVPDSYVPEEVFKTEVPIKKSNLKVKDIIKAKKVEKLSKKIISAKKSSKIIDLIDNPELKSLAKKTKNPAPIIAINKCKSIRELNDLADEWPDEVMESNLVIKAIDIKCNLLSDPEMMSAIQESSKI